MEGWAAAISAHGTDLEGISGSVRPKVNLPARVLVVEDEAVVARHIAAALARRGFEVVGRATSGEAAIRMASELRPDLLLADIHLSGQLDGVEAVTAIQQEQDLAVVYLTAYSDSPTLQRAVQTNPCGYVVKPFTEDGLSCALQVALSKHRSERESRRRAERDELTGLYNRGAFLTLAEHMRRCAHRDGRAIAVFFFDLDGFKRINDELGHSKGDACLRAFATALEGTFRKSDVLARLGGDEFAALMMDPPAELAGILRRFRAELQASGAGITDGYRLDTSVGIAIASRDASTSVAHLLSEADAAMYADKRARCAERALV